MKKSAILSAFVFVIAAGLAACGSDSGSGSGGVNKSATSASYKVEYIADAQPAMGKSVFTLKISKGGAAAPGLAVSLAPDMDMGGHGNMKSSFGQGLSSMDMNMNSHGAPVEDVTDNGDGTYTGTVYYLMAGMWTLNVNVEGETASFMLDVAAAGADTPMAKLVSQNQMIMGMGGGMEPMPYFIFNEGASNGAFHLFIAARHDMYTYPHIHGAAVEASTDGATWLPMMDHGGGHYMVSGLEGLHAGTQAQIHVKLAVNGVACTMDGSADDGANNHQTFKVTP